MSRFFEVVDVSTDETVTVVADDWETALEDARQVLAARGLTDMLLTVRQEYQGSVRPVRRAPGVLDHDFRL